MEGRRSAGVAVSPLQMVKNFANDFVPSRALLHRFWLRANPPMVVAVVCSTMKYPKVLVKKVVSGRPAEHGNRRPVATSQNVELGA